MNERILELAKEHLRHEMYAAYGEIIEGDYYEFDPEELQKFAELIVQECILLIQLSTARDPQNTVQYKQSVGHIHKIRDHFGIVPTIDDQLRSHSTYFGNNP
jgi:succinylglutamate desuccinylase